MRWPLPTALLALLALLGLVAWAQTRPPLPRVVRAAPPDTGRETALERGHRVYERYGCGLCHGADAKGGFANRNAETDGKVPGLTFAAEGFTRAELKKKIVDGLATIGRGDAKGPRPPYRMPDLGAQMTDAELSDLVEYLMSLLPKSGTAEKWR
jgi:mono/diheme cytochrome c family protein